MNKLSCMHAYTDATRCVAPVLRVKKDTPRDLGCQWNGNERARSRLTGPVHAARRRPKGRTAYIWAVDVLVSRRRSD